MQPELESSLNVTVLLLDSLPPFLTRCTHIKPHCVLQWTLDGKGNKKAKVKKGQGIKGRQQQPKKPMAQRRVAPPHSSSESSEDEEGVEEEEGDNQVRHAIVCPQQEIMAVGNCRC